MTHSQLARFLGLCRIKLLLVDFCLLLDFFPTRLIGLHSQLSKTESTCFLVSLIETAPLAEKMIRTAILLGMNIINVLADQFLTLGDRKPCT